MTDPQQFRKKPVVIEAMQWDGSAESATPAIDWILEQGGTARFHEAQEEVRDTDGKGCPASDAFVMIDTLEGSMMAIPGDWIIRGVQGEFYPCKPDIFEATYEPVVPMIDDRRLTDAGERLVPAYPLDTPAQAQRAREEGQTYSLDGPLCEHDVSDPGQSECRCRLMRGHGGIHQCKHTLGKREEVSRG